MTADASLPVDPDVLDHNRSAQLSIGKIALVVLGGTLGSLVRGLVAEVFATTELDIATVVVNISGAFLLGILVSYLAAANPPKAVQWKLFLGTGFAGGFTTYSAFAFMVMTNLISGQIWLLTTVGLGTVFVGGAASYLGIVIGARIGRRVT